MSIAKAIVLAHFAHKDQKRKYNGKPYISHPQRVADTVRKIYPIWNLKEQEVIEAAWLHDVLEDCRDKVTPEMIVEATSEETLQLVKELTNCKDLAPNGVVMYRTERKQRDRERLATVSDEAKLIKLVDRNDNLKELSTDISNGLCTKEFGLLYAEESEQLLYVIHSANLCAATELLKSIAKLYYICS